MYTDYGWNVDYISARFVWLKWLSLNSVSYRTFSNDYFEWKTQCYSFQHAFSFFYAVGRTWSSIQVSNLSHNARFNCTKRSYWRTVFFGAPIANYSRSVARVSWRERKKYNDFDTSSIKYWSKIPHDLVQNWTHHLNPNVYIIMYFEYQIFFS